MTLEEAMVTVWRAALLEKTRELVLDGQKFPIRQTPRKRLLEVDLPSRGKHSVNSSRTQTPNRGGRNWLAKATEGCSSSSLAGTSAT